MTCPSPETERAGRLYTGRSYGTRERGPRAGWQMGGGWHLWQYYQTHESTDDAYVAGHVVPISPQVNGTVLVVHIADHQTVEADQVLAQLDARASKSRVKHGEAAVAVATANLRRAELEVALTQESTSTETDRTRATLRGAQIATQKVVQRVPVKIRLDMPVSAPFVLRPGMSVIATVTTRD
jgi:multidrug resistance efflux pump